MHIQIYSVFTGNCGKVMGNNTAVHQVIHVYKNKYTLIIAGSLFITIDLYKRIYLHTHI